MRTKKVIKHDDEKVTRSIRFDDKFDTLFRDTIMRIKKDGREIWEYASGYSKRNMAENAMFRYKNNIGK